jgi:predicted ABC-type ATPase
VPDLVILGGPNGAGKTTAAQNVLRRELGLREFVNADEIARGLSPFNPEGVALSAGRLMLDRMQTLIRERESFAFETTCAGTTHVRLLQQCKAAGWRVTLIFLWLPDPQAAVERVARRVRVGGHRIPDDVIVRRYWAGLAKMRQLYLPLADVAVIFDNSDGPLILIAERTPDGAFVVYDGPRWAAIERAQA